MRIILILSILITTGCSYGFTFHPEEMTPDQMLERAELVFVGVVEGQHIDSWPFFKVPKTAVDWRVWNMPLWRPLRRRVRVATVLRGTYSFKEIDVYEVHGGIASNTNFLRNGQRYLFLVRKENGRWQIVRDFWRSIYPAETGYHSRLPLGESRPFWERYALMNYWMDADQDWFGERVGPHFRQADPAHKLGLWRETKLLRGLLVHPQPRVRLGACLELLFFGGRLDECRQSLPESDAKATGLEGGAKWTEKDDLQLRDNFEWYLFVSSLPPSELRFEASAMDELRVMTSINHPSLRREFCRKFMAKFPNDSDNGCAANHPFPATIVTENGDVPLVGPWPSLTRTLPSGQ